MGWRRLRTVKLIMGKPVRVQVKAEGWGAETDISGKMWMLATRGPVAPANRQLLHFTYEEPKTHLGGKQLYYDGMKRDECILVLSPQSLKKMRRTRNL